MESHSFRHFETETEDATIKRFDAMLDNYSRQEIDVEEEAVERALLDQPHKRYKHLKKTW